MRELQNGISILPSDEPIVIGMLVVEIGESTYNIDACRIRIFALSDAETSSNAPKFQ